MTRFVKGILLAFLTGCGGSVTAPPVNGTAQPSGTFLLIRSAQDSSSEIVAAPVDIGTSCVTFVSRLRFVAPDSVIATRQFILPASGGNNTIVTEVDAGIATQISNGMLRLAYPTRVDTASVQQLSGAVTEVDVSAHFVNSAECPTGRISLSYRPQVR